MSHLQISDQDYNHLEPDEIDNLIQMIKCGTAEDVRLALGIIFSRNLELEKYVDLFVEKLYKTYIHRKTSAPLDRDLKILVRILRSANKSDWNMLIRYHYKDIECYGGGIEAS